MMLKQKTEFKQTEIGLIPEDWEVKKLGDIAKFQYGLGESAEESGEFVYIRITDITQEGFLMKNGMAYLNKNKVPEDYVLTRGDVLVARTGATYGKTYLFRDNFRATFGGFLIRLLFDKKVIDNDFFFQFTRSYLYWNQANNLVTGGAQPQFNANVISEILTPLPPLTEQKRIASILSQIDDKIELNRKMNKTLEAIGQALFKHWFVDFEFPNERGEPYKSSGGEMVDSELGKMPKGWKVGKISDEFNLTMGQSPPGDSYNEISEGVAFFQGRTDFGFRYPTKRIFCTEPAKFASPGDTLVSVRAPVGDINMANEKCCIGRGVAAIRHKTSSRSYSYYSMKNLRDSFSHFEAEGTVFGSIGKTDFEKIKIIVPSETLIKLFEKITYCLDQRIETNCLIIEMLSQTRDSLLPKLISGKIRVPIGVD